MIMVLQVGEQGRARSRRRRRRRRRPNAVVRLLFHAVSISSADAAARSCRLPTWGSEGEGAGPAGAESGRPESGWAAGRVGAPNNPNPRVLPPLMSGMAASLSLSLSLYLSLLLLGMEEQEFIASGRWRRRSPVPLSLSLSLFLLWFWSSECAANDFGAVSNDSRQNFAMLIASMQWNTTLTLH